MHLQAIVPFMQLTWNNDPANCEYSIETVVPIESRYQLTSTNLTTTPTGDVDAELVFHLTAGYTENPEEDGITHVMRKFKVSNFPPPTDPTNDKSASVTVTVFEEEHGGPGTQMEKKKSKMQLAEAEVGVDPTVHY